MSIFHNLKKILQTGLASVINILVSLVRTKLIALYTGSQGVGILGQLSNLNNIAQLTSTFGASSGFVNEFAQSINDKNEQWRDQLKSGFITLVIFGSLLTSSLIFVLADSINGWLFPKQDFVFYIKLIALNSLFLGPVLFFPSILQANLKIRELMIYSIVVSLLSTIVTVGLLIIAGLDGVIYSFAVNSIMALFIGLISVKPLIVDFHKFIKTDIGEYFSIFRQLLKYGIAGLITSISFQVGYTIIKGILIKQGGGLEDAGLYQSVSNISNQYLPVLLTSLSTYLIPKLANTEESLRHESVNHSMRAITLLALPIILILALFSDKILIALYSDEFLAASALLSWMVIADLIKIINRVMGSVIIVLKNFKLWIIIDVLSIGTTIGLTYLLYPRYGLTGISFAFIITQFLILVTYVLALNKLKGFRISSRVYGILIIGIILILFINLSEFGILIKSIVSLSILIFLIHQLLTREERLTLIERMFSRKKK